MTYATGDGTAVAGSDYVSATAQVGFSGNDGETRLVTVQINGIDRQCDETFTLAISNVRKFPSSDPYPAVSAAGSIPAISNAAMPTSP